MRPSEAYASRLADWEARIGALQRVVRRFGTARLSLAAAALAIGWMAWHAHWFSARWLFLPLAAFLAIVIVQSRRRRELTRTLRQAVFYRRAIARLEDRWAGTGCQGRPTDDTYHVYAADLDLFGEGSLFELLCAARTAMGEQTLAAWLLGPADLLELRGRQESIEDLRQRLDLRERIAVLGEDGATIAQPLKQAAWARTANVLARPGLGILAAALPAALLSATLWGWIRGEWMPAMLILAAEAAALYWLRRRIEPTLGGAAAADAAGGLRAFAQLLHCVEHEPFGSNPLRALQGELVSGDRHSSAAMGRLAWIGAFAEARESLAVRWFLTIPLLYPLQVALAAERWRAHHSADVPRWIEATERFEALVSLAQYRFEHPDFPYPRFEDEAGLLEARGLGHPLLPAARCVPNDVRLSERVPLLLVSGSNMSGKSTLLRAVGLNVVLAMAGAPVCAQSLRLAPMSLGASIRVTDSLREGQSRFSAELGRLRQIVALAESGATLLFLIDELLQGTNSHDRRAGAEGLLHALLARGAVGIITTHDLALTDMAALAGRVNSVHFRETLSAGQMHFDYTLHPGVVQTRNGLELMRAMGLQV